MRRQAKAPSAGSKTRRANDCGRYGTVFALLAALLAFSGIGASSALAGQTRLLEPFSPIDGSGSGVSITNPVGLALDEESGNVFLSDAGTQVEILGAENGVPAGLVAPFELTGFSFETEKQTYPLVIDNSATSPNHGSLYVTAADGLIKRYARNAGTELYELADEISYAGSASVSGATVDEDGNLFVSDFGDQAVYKFDTTGALLKTISFASNGITRPNGLAVDSAGDLFVRRAGGGEVYKCPADVLGEIDPAECSIFIDSGANGIAVDSATDTLYISFSNHVDQYDAITLTKEFEFGLGALVSALGVVVNSATDRVYVADNDAGKRNVAVFGPPITLPSATTKAASNVTGTKATLNGVVNPQANAITECKFEYGPTTSYGSTIPCESSIPTDSNDHAVSAQIGGLIPNGTSYHFRLVVESVNGPASPTPADRSFVTANTVITEGATAIAEASATLNGTVRPEGVQLTGCTFEYGTTTLYGETAPCDPLASTIPDDFDSHAVSGVLSGLDPNTTYHFRLKAVGPLGTFFGVDRSFTTFGPPQIIEQRPLDASQSEVTLQAKIDPSGSPTTYHFEFGPDTSYGTRIPTDHDLFAGSGTEPATVSAYRNGLQEASVYHFRVVATNSSGTTVGPDQWLETLNSEGLPDSRGFELVSPADKGTSGSVAELNLFDQLFPKASADGNAFLYPIQNGIPDSTAGGWSRWQAERTASGWVSAQLSAPSLIPPPGSGFSAEPSHVVFTPPDLNCAIVKTYNPLTADTPQQSIERGVENLYRRNQDGSFDLITNRAPLNEAGSAFLYRQVDASDDCSRVYFASAYRFISGGSGLYEWNEGTLRDAGVLPDGTVGASMSSQLFGTEKAVSGSELGSLSQPTDHWNAVSPKGALFFTAVSDEGPDSGTAVVFMREGGDEVVDISQSQTAVATNGARYETASPDGERVIFRANYGIANTSSAGSTNEACGTQVDETDYGSNLQIEEKACDLYAYDVGTGELTDLSADPNPADPIGAAIQGVVAVDNDGSHVYFAALGQLVPGKGRTYAQNIAGGGSANVYLYHDGQLAYVTTLERGTLFENRNDLLGGGLMRRGITWTAEASADGRSLVFESVANLTGYNSGGVKEAYLYSADTGRLTCLSCRLDGRPALSSETERRLARPRSLRPNRPRTMSEDGNRIFFTSPDVLSLGAVAGERNVYEWEKGQIRLLLVAQPTGANGLGEYLDTSASGDDVFIATSEQLVPQDTDFVSDVYDLRVDGGFPSTPESPRCQVDEAVPLEANQIYCQGDRTPSPAAPAPASAGFQGSGNPPAAGQSSPSACPKGKVRRHGRCVKRPARKHKAHKSKRAHRRAANNDRGGAR